MEEFLMDGAVQQVTVMLILWYILPYPSRMDPSLVLLVLYWSVVASLKVCSFNVRSFGGSKMCKPQVLDVLVKCIERCDIMLIMEIKDAKGQALPQLVSHLNSKFGKKNEFEFIASERLGRKWYKEQYAFVYRQSLVSVKAVYQYPDLQTGDEDVFAREPFVVWFSSPKTAIKEFVIIPIHTSPEMVVREINELYDVYQDIRERWTSENFILMGDFNAACSYLPKKQWKKIHLRSNSSFVWLIDDRTDTTVKDSTSCAYDRVVLHGKDMINAVDSSTVEVFDFRMAYRLTEEEALAHPGEARGSKDANWAARDFGVDCPDGGRRATLSFREQQQQPRLLTAPLQIPA
ncbi:deoxyribonuclease gamma isoform X1 [Arapaima gigas]